MAERGIHRSHSDLVRSSGGDDAANLARLSHFVSASPGIIYARALEDPAVLTFVSENVASRLGYDARDFLDRRGFWLSLVHPDDAELAAQQLSQLPSGGAHSFEYRILHRDGSYRFIRDESKVICDSTMLDGSGRPAEIVGSWLDVTSQKEAERSLDQLTRRLARSNRELEQFAYVASHDLRAPLRAIDTLSQWLDEDLADVLQGEAREQMRLLRGRVRRMDRLLADLLEYARVGRVRSPLELVDTEELIREVADLSQLETLRINIIAPLPSFRTAKPPFKRVLMNLLSNVAKHTDHPTAQVEISCTEEDDFYLFSFKDDGPGIAKEFHERIFQMFQTLKPRDTTEGSGMGLALVRRIVESGGGKITVESTNGRGTTFKFTWPKEWIEAAPVSQSSLRAATPKAADVP